MSNIDPCSETESPKKTKSSVAGYLSILSLFERFSVLEPRDRRSWIADSRAGDVDGTQSRLRVQAECWYRPQPSRWPIRCWNINSIVNRWLAELAWAMQVSDIAKAVLKCDTNYWQREIMPTRISNSTISALVWAILSSKLQLHQSCFRGMMDEVSENWQYQD